jgi:hypothetical protein
MRPLLLFAKVWPTLEVWGVIISQILFIDYFSFIVCSWFSVFGMPDTQILTICHLLFCSLPVWLVHCLAGHFQFIVCQKFYWNHHHWSFSNFCFTGSIFSLHFSFIVFIIFSYHKEKYSHIRDNCFCVTISCSSHDPSLTLMTHLPHGMAAEGRSWIDLPCRYSLEWQNPSKAISLDSDSFHCIKLFKAQSHSNVSDVITLWKVAHTKLRSVTTIIYPISVNFVDTTDPPSLLRRHSFGLSRTPPRRMFR